MNCIESKREDLKALVRCQMLAFPDALSTKLGNRFTNKMLLWYIESDRGIIYHLELDGEILGYVGGIKTTRPGLPGAATSITQYSFGVFLTAFFLRPWLIFHPENIKRLAFIWRNIKMKFGLSPGSRNIKTEVNNGNFLPSMGLVVIGVSPEHQGKGYGSLLLKEFESRARKEGFKKISLSVRKENSQAITAYKRNGWLVSREGPSELYMYKELD